MSEALKWPISDSLPPCTWLAVLRDAVLLKLLAKLLTICVIFADQTRLVMADVSAHLAAAPLPKMGHARRAQGGPKAPQQHDA